MASPNETEQTLLSKIQNLPPDKVVEVEDFVDFLLARTADQPLAQSAAKMSEPAFARVWDNPDDAAYDDL